MKLSIIVPVYNCEAYLVKCLDSLVNQEFLHSYEIIVVNDGSTDGSQSIINDYVDKYPKLIRAFTKENGGQSSARNLGLTYASGEYISFIDSDDWLDLDFYRKGIALADEHQFDVVVYDMMDHYPTYTIHHTCSHFENRFKMSLSASNKIFRHATIQAFTFMNGVWYEDLEFTARVFMLDDKVGRIHDSFYHCHCREESTMTNHNAPKNIDIITVFDSLISFAKEHDVYEKYKDILDYMILDHILITSINRVARQHHPQREHVIKQLRAYVKKNIPNHKERLKALGFSKNRYMIACLNATGHHHLAKRILNLSAKLKH